MIECRVGLPNSCCTQITDGADTQPAHIYTFLRWCICLSTHNHNRDTYITDLTTERINLKNTIGYSKNHYTQYEIFRNAK